ncbi:thioredoxin domain-containing protein [Sphingobacterium pedocola]|uniref:Thioredoxin domain-containing protein n=1 Tax=Sphingobacterium pedocola TaxID=2082722 RepID=A0ABR9T2T5_9SPHI|nr:redoxin domain-containing protein [Sphingobacterium pedocola]MBE8719658.1 hypothetical protein [Sphingobacterium pedocola]
MRKLRKRERYVLFPKTKDNPLEGEIPLSIAQKEVQIHTARPKPVAFIRTLFGAFTPLLRKRALTASGKGNPFFGNPSTALRVGFDSLPKNSRSAVEQQSKTSRTRLEYMSKRSRRTLEQHPKECRTAVEQQTKKWDNVEKLISTSVNVEERRVLLSIDASYRQHDMPGVREVLSSKFVHSYPEQVLPIRQVCVKYTLSNDIVLKGYSTKALISAVRWPYAMAILYKIADIFKSTVHKNGTSTIQNPYYANTTDRVNTLPDTYQVLPASDRHGFSTASHRLRAPMAIGARSDNDQSAKPEKQNMGRSRGEQKQNTVRTASGKSAVHLWSLYQKATVSIRVTYQKYTLDLLKTYQRLTKKLPTVYHEVGNKLQAAYAKFKNNLHCFSKYCVALWCDNQLGFKLITSRYYRSRTLFCKPFAIWLISFFCSYVLFSEAQAQSVETRTVDGLNEIEPLQIGDTIPEALWNLPLQVVNHPDGKDTITLNDYRDKKLIILDFWATWCSPCIKSLHKLDHILPEFEQDLFVLPSSIEETSLVKKKFDSEKFSLMTAVEQIALRKYFPCQFLPHQVWIAENRLYITTGGEASSRENILGFLTGETPDLKNKSDVFFKPYDFIDQYAIERNAPLITKSIVTGYIEGTGNSGRRSNDSLQTYFFLNRPVIDIIKSALKISYNEIQLQNATDMAWMINTEQDISNLFCYQLFAAATTDQKDIKRKMTADLSNAFALEMQWKSMLVNCHVLSVLDKNKPQKYDKKGYPLSSLVDMLNYVIEWKSDLPVFLDETGLDWYLPERPSNKLIDSWRENPEKLKGMLEDLGLTISIQKREIAMLIVSAAADNEELVTGTLKNPRKR